MPDQRYHFRVSAVNSRGAGTRFGHQVGGLLPQGSDGGVTTTYRADWSAIRHDRVPDSRLKICWYEQNDRGMAMPSTEVTAALDEGLPGYWATRSPTAETAKTEVVGWKKTP